MALLCIVDDGHEDGEWRRLRGDRVVIGRSEGDILVPHDAMISGRHAELSRQFDRGRYSWQLTDLQSTNGTYVRVGAARLKHNQELLLGGGRYRFDAAPQGVAALTGSAGAPAEQGASTRGWQAVSPAELFPSLVELTPQGEGQRFLLTKDDLRIGRDADSCDVVLNDPLVSPRHARLRRDAKGRWQIENTKSVNGTWVRINQMALDAACLFQLGEQRFLFRVL
jgi:pSer/pThr/pTyr-binding forkhead associated (FHA) protein